jgi:RNA polymerase sigma-70 factor (ECF subfamily)
MDKAAFAARAMACERKLYRVARTLLRADADCEDAVQEALIRAWQSRDSLREEQYFDTWLTRILINECRNLQRRRPPTVPLEPDLDAARPKETGALLAALTALPEKQRLVMTLHYVEGYPVEAVAGILKIPAGTVKWRLSRGRKRLREDMKEEGP